MQAGIRPYGGCAPTLVCEDFSLPPAFFFEKCHLPRQREDCGRFVNRPYGIDYQKKPLLYLEMYCGGFFFLKSILLKLLQSVDWMQ